MRKELIILLLLLILLTGCPGGKTPPTTASGYIGGTDGVASKLSIVSGQTNEVLDSGLEDFEMNVDLENKGEHAIKENEVLATITGVDYNAFSLKQPSLRNVEPLGEIRNEGGKVPGGQAALSFKANFADDLPVDQVYDLGVNVCYKYQTGATTNLCLRKDATKRGEATDKCKVDDPKPSVSSSSAPIQVKSIFQRPTGKNEVSFTLTIENVGKGDVYLPTFLDTAQHCLDKADVKNKVEVSVSFANNKPAVVCPALQNSNKGTLQLIQNKAVLTCKIDTSKEQETTFTRSPNIQVSYVYKDLVSTKVTVKNAA